jgi:hypothetical protein
VNEQNPRPADIPREVGGLRVLAACPRESYLPLSNNDGMWGLGEAGFEPFQSLAICDDPEDSGGVFVFFCASDWMTLADGWHLTFEEALAAVEDMYPGIGRALVRP